MLLAVAVRAVHHDLGRLLQRVAKAVVVGEELRGHQTVLALALLNKIILLHWLAEHRVHLRNSQRAEEVTVLFGVPEVAKPVLRVLVLLQHLFHSVV